MSLNDIQLSAQLLEALYSNTLVLSERNRPVAEPARAAQAGEPVSSTIQCLGKNNRHFVVLVNYADQLHLPDESFNFLGTVLKACQLNAADIAIINLANQSVQLPELLLQFNPTIILDFCTDKKTAGLPDTPLLQPLATGQFKYMAGPALEAFQQSDDAAKPLKKQLWDSLKSMLQL